MTRLAPATGLALATALILTVSGCGDFFHDPAPAGPARVAVTLRQATDGAAAAFDAADNLAVDVRVDGSTVAAESVPVSATGASLEVPVEVPLPDGGATARLGVELRRGEASLFRGQTDVDLAPGVTTRATLALEPVVAAIEATAPPVFTIYGQTAELDATAVFATGDAVPGSNPAWTSLDPSVVSVEPSGGGWRAVAVADGVASLRAEWQGRSTSVTAEVDAVVVSVDVTPAAATLTPGETLVLTAVLRDGGGSPIPGRTPQWASDDPTVADVDTDGTVTALGPGTTEVRATRDGVSGSAQVTVRPAGPGVTTLPPIGIRPDSAIFRARVDPGGSTTQVVFEYDTVPSLTQAATTAASTVSGSAPPTDVSRSVQGLQPGTTYYVRAVATNADGTTVGDVVSFTTLDRPNAPSGLRGTFTGAVRLTWRDNSDDETRFEIEREYVGPGGVPAAAGTVPARVFQSVGSVAADVTTFDDTGPPTGELRYRVRACSATACSLWSPPLTWFYGLPPRVQTLPATDVDFFSATLAALINPLDAPSVVQWEVAFDPSFSRQTVLIPSPPIDAGIGHVDVFRSLFLGQIQPGTTYYVRAVAANTWGSTIGNVVVFVTPDPG